MGTRWKSFDGGGVEVYPAECIHDILMMCVFVYLLNLVRATFRATCKDNIATHDFRYYQIYNSTAAAVQPTLQIL